MSKPLFEGSITNVHGIRVGQAENRVALTGVTVVLCGREGAGSAASVGVIVDTASMRSCF